MAKNSIASAFDTKTRAKIRAALKAYMKSHRIGVPTLWDRVLKADPKKRDVSMPTMQRLIRGTHHSSEMLMEMSMQFLQAEGIELPAADLGPLGAFGTSLATFHDVGQTQTPTEERAASLAGEYNKVASQTEPVYPILRLAIERADEQPYMPVKETHTLLAGEAELRFEGALICVDGMNYIALRDALTRRPKNYWLERIKTADGFADKYLTGESSEMLFRQEPDDSTIRREKLTLQAKG